MKKNLPPWLDQVAVTDGVLAGGVLSAAGKCLYCGDREKYPAEKIEKLLRQFSSLHAPLPPAEFSPRWTTWQFDYGWFRFVPRPDKLLLLLVVTPGSGAARELDQFAADFLALPL